MRHTFTVLLVPTLLLLGSVTVFAGDAELPYRPVTRPPVITLEPLLIQPADPVAIEREKEIAAGKNPDTFSSPWHNHGQ